MIEHTTIEGAFDLLEDAMDQKKMRLMRVIDELTNYLYGVGDVWPSHGQVK